MAHATHLILEQPLQRFAELQLHIFGKSAHVVVALDGHAGDAQALDAVGIYGALCQPFRIGNLLCLGVEHLNEVAADNLTLLLRVGHAFKVLEEPLRGVYAYDVEPQSLISFHHLAELVFTQHAVVDEDTREVLADGFVEQGGADGGVDATRQSEDDAVGANLLLQFLYRAFDE